MFNIMNIESIIHIGLVDGNTTIITEDRWTTEIQSIVDDWDKHYDLVKVWISGDRSTLNINDEDENSISKFNVEWSKMMIKQHKRNWTINKLLE